MTLAYHAGNDGVTWVSQRTLAEENLLAQSTVRRAISDLESLGEIEVRQAQRGRKRINVCRVLFTDEDVDYAALPFTLTEPFTTAQFERSSERTTAESEPATTAQSEQVPDSSPLIEKSKRGNRQRESASHSLAVQGNREAPKLVKIEGRNLGFDALVTVTMANPKAEGSRIAKALALIRDLVWDELLPGVKAIIAPEQFEQVIADAIKDRAKTYECTWPNVELTPTALSTNWSRIIVSSTRQKKFRPKGGLTPEGIRSLADSEEGE